MGGGGVDGAIHKAAGRGLADECRKLMGCLPGDAKITGAHALPAKKVIHTVGPIYFSDEVGAPVLLANCYQKSLELAKQYKMTSIAFPALSTGIYGYPMNEATTVAARTVRKWLDSPMDPNDSSSPLNSSIMYRVIFCVYSAKDEEVYNRILPSYFPPTQEDLAAEKEGMEMDEDSDSGLAEESGRHSG